MVHRLFADVIHDAIWFMNIHEQNHPWFLAMINVVSSNPPEMYSIQHNVIKFDSDLRQDGGFLLVLRFPPPIKRYNTEILLKVVLNITIYNP
jgi:hypothetical protein